MYFFFFVVVTADDALMLAREVKDKKDVATLSCILSQQLPRPVRSSSSSSSSDDPPWFYVLNMIMEWRRSGGDHSRKALVCSLLTATKDSTGNQLCPEKIELLKRMARNLDIQSKHFFF